MRKIIIDTDTGSDDAVALMMALKDEIVDILAITTVSGNCHLDQATLNCMATLEQVNKKYPPVYKGSYKPLFRDLFTAEGVHGEDGMGDQDLVHPTRTHQEGNAIDKILELVKKYPNEIDIITIGPLTNIAKSILLDLETMKQVKRIYSMGTQGLGPGNCTPVSEFNVYVDAESYKIVVESGIPVTIVGFDICLGDSALHKVDLDYLLNSGSNDAEFAVKINKTLYEYNLNNTGEEFIDLPDPVAMGVYLWEEIVLDKVDCHAEVIINQDATYGQVIFYNDTRLDLTKSYESFPKNVTLITRIDTIRFKEKLIETLVK